jgi:hypothetical protein
MFLAELANAGNPVLWGIVNHFLDVEEAINECLG